LRGLQQEICSFGNCGKPGRVELSRSVEVVGREAFSADEDGGGREAAADFPDGRRRVMAPEKAARMPGFIAGKGSKRKRTARLLFSESFRI
jgi:hypothetical protein